MIQVIFEIINLSITTKTPLIQFVIVERILKLRATFSSLSLYTNEKLALLNVIQGIHNSILKLTDSHIAEVLLYGSKVLDISSNANILNPTIDFLLKIERSDRKIFQSKNQLNNGFLHFHFSRRDFLLKVERSDRKIFQSKNQLNNGFLHFHFSSLTSFFIN